MCLQRLEKFTPCRSGYKVMGIKKKVLYGEYCSTHSSRPMGVWLEEAKFRDKPKGSTVNMGSKVYPTGWHVFHRKEAALAWLSWSRKSKVDDCVLVSVDVRRAVATGMQNQMLMNKPFKVTVAKEIKITAILDY